MKDLFMMDPENLFVEVDRAHLYEGSRELGKAAPHDQRYWIASVDSASSAACHVNHGKYFDLIPEDEFVDLGENVIPIDTKGGIRYQKHHLMDSR